MGIFPLLLKPSRRIALTESPLYFYRTNPNGVSAVTQRTPAGSMDRALIFIERYDMVKDWVPDTMPLILKKALWFSISAYTFLNSESSKTYSEGYETIRSFLKEHSDEISRSPLIDKPRKTAARLIASGHTLPFRMLSSLRPAAKKIINLLQGTNNNTKL